MSAGKRGSILSIDSVSHAHAGKYTCVAKNKAGEATYSADLNVNGYYFFLYFRCCFRLFYSFSHFPIAYPYNQNYNKQISDGHRWEVLEGYHH